MISLRGPKLSIFAGILAVVCFITGVYITFFQSRGFIKSSGVIVSMELNEDAIGDEDPTYFPVVEYSVDGKAYTARLDQSSPSDEIGKTVTILYDPDDPSVVHGGKGIGIYCMVLGAAILAFVIFSAIKNQQSQKELQEYRESRGQTGYAPSVQGEERELYFLTDLGTPKYGHRIEDTTRKTLYEAKMTKFSITGPFEFDFIDHVRGTTTPHLVGHNEESEWNSLLIDNHYTFELDGEEIFKHLEKNGISVETSVGSGMRMNYRILRDGNEIASAEASSQYPHEDDAAEHKLSGAIPAQGFYRVWTREQNLDLLFVTLLAFARSGAMDDRGGSFGALAGTLKQHIK